MYKGLINKEWQLSVTDSNIKMKKKPSPRVGIFSLGLYY